MKIPTPAELDYLERFGRFWETSGASRSTGRIVAWLMICEPKHQSAADLMDALGVSSGTISTLTRQLVDLAMVERVTFPGDRSSYYQLRDHAWLRMIEGQMGVFNQLTELATAGRDLVPAGHSRRVDELSDVMSFFAVEWPVLMTRLRDQLDGAADAAADAASVA